MSHRLMSAYSKCCENVHGHSYKAEVFVYSSNYLNKDGMVIDFGLVKKVIQPIIDEWDHCIMLYEKDPLVKKLKKSDIKIITKQYNPTAENMANDLYHAINTKLNHPSYMAFKIRIHETDTGWAEYSERI